MRRIIAGCLVLSLAIAPVTGCSESETLFLEPMMGVDWFSEYNEVKEIFNEYSLIEEREIVAEGKTQQMQDYSDVSLFEKDCDLTLCFTDNGLVGFNYHDTEKSAKYKEWFGLLEEHYGYPTEEGTGMASWYDNPLGTNTAVYLFNLQEGVQISFYASSDSPDKSFEKQEDVYIPVPELRTPIVPVVEESVPVATSTTTVATEPDQENTVINTENIYHHDIIVSPDVNNENEIQEETSEEATETTTENEEAVVTTTGTDSEGNKITHTTVSTVKTTTTTTTTAVRTTTTTTTTVNPRELFALNDLEFYGARYTECRKMSGYTQQKQYNVNEPGQVKQTIVEYTGTQYLGKSCDTILCFTSVGLVGINYFDNGSLNYSGWVRKLKDIYGTPVDSQFDYTAWYDNSLGNNMVIYVFSMGDGVQISFYVDDTGSEIA